MKKRLLSCMLAFLVAFLVTMPVLAVDPPATELAQAIAGEVHIAGGEQTQIYFRTVDGVLQFRVWSITYGYWKTDWMDF